MFTYRVFEKNIFDLSGLNTLEDIAVENLDTNKGTLHLSLYDMLKILYKHNITPRILVVCGSNGYNIGYCMFYTHNGNIHISHICIRNKYQRFGCGKQLVDWLKLCQPNAITADVSYDNHKSKAFFNKMGFDFECNDEKKRWRVSWRQ